MKERAELLKRKLGEYVQDKNEYFYKCINKKCESHSRNKKKMSVNFSKGIYHCWICNYSGPIKKLIKRYGKDINFLLSWQNLDKNFNLDLINIINFQIDAPYEHQEILELPVEFESLIDNNSKQAARAKKYLENRNFSEEDYYFWKPGICKEGMYKNYIIFPSFDLGGELNFYIGRNYIDEYRKYIQPNRKSQDIIFNEYSIDWEKPIILVEGIFDAIVSGGVAMMGSFFTEKHKLFKEIVKNDSIVYVCLDQDAQKKEMKIISRLNLYGIKIYKINIEPYKDPGSMSKLEFSERLKNSSFVENLFDYELTNILEGTK